MEYRIIFFTRIFLLASAIVAYNAAPYTQTDDEYEEVWDKTDDDVGMAEAILGAAVTGAKVGSSRSSFSRRRKRPEPELYDGLDMIITKEQADWLYGRNKNKTRTKRGGTTMKTKLWSDGVVHYIIKNGDFDAEETSQLKEAMSVYESETCVTFVQRSAQVSYAQFQSGKGCNSWLGKKGEEMQPINLGKGCKVIGTYLHEIGHCLGMVHEHQLPQRDEYVFFNPTNVNPSYASQLDKYDPDVMQTYDTEYDLSSIMHYETNSFSVDKVSPTLGVGNPYLTEHIGRRYSNLLSYGDVKTVNRLYKCADKCSSAERPACPDGFINHKCQCVTPDSYYARHCKNDPTEEASCYEKLRTEKCRRSDYKMQKQCAKACDFCPRFKPGDTARNGLGPCQNIYHDAELCNKWSEAGDCDHSNKIVRNWMKRYCKLSCEKCDVTVGNCPNIWPNNICDSYPERGTCSQDNRNGANARKNCPDSCSVCHERPQGDCENTLSDAVCTERAKNRECQNNPRIMFQLCPKTCNRCDYNQGKCRNMWTKESECMWWAAINWCTSGINKQFMLENCAKACNSCDIARKKYPHV